MKSTRIQLVRTSPTDARRIQASQLLTHLSQLPAGSRPEAIDVMAGPPRVLTGVAAGENELPRSVRWYAELGWSPVPNSYLRSSWIQPQGENPHQFVQRFSRDGLPRDSFQF